MKRDCNLFDKLLCIDNKINNVPINWLKFTHNLQFILYLNTCVITAFVNINTQLIIIISCFLFFFSQSKYRNYNFKLTLFN